MIPMKSSSELTVTASDVRREFSSLVNRVYKEEARVVVERSGLPVAAIVPMSDLGRLRQLDHEIAERRKLLETLRAPFREVPPEEIEVEVAKALTEVRAEMRAERAPRRDR
jgi:prevent-host-death family protein